MTKKQKLEKLFKEDFFNKGQEEFECEEIESFIQSAEGQKILSYGIVARTPDCDFWYEAITGANIKGKFIGIIFDYDAISTKRHYDKEEMIERLLELEKEAIRIKKLLKTIK